VEATTVRYNALFLFAYWLAFVGAYLLAREFRLRPAAAAIAGAAFAYAPWRLEQDGHLHVLSSGGIPLTLFLLLRGYRRGSVGTIVAGWLVAAWQVSLGFTLGLLLGYLLGFLGICVLIWLWHGGREKLPPKRVLWATAGGASRVRVTGGTHVPWSPPTDYLQEVLFPALARMGVQARLEEERWGFFPRGGGRICVEIAGRAALSAVTLVRQPRGGALRGLSAVARMPRSVAERQSVRARERLVCQCRLGHI